MDWRDRAIVLGGRRFGEGGLVLDVLTETRGRRAGLVHGGASRARKADFEPGNTVTLAWRGRLESQLGRFEGAEVDAQRAARLLDQPEALAAIASVTSLLRAVLDEGDPSGSGLFTPSVLLLEALESAEVWPALYVRWELGLLAALGFGLDFSACAITGANDGLTHVSPRTGRAVRGSEAEHWLDRLLPLPAFLTDPAAPAGPEAIRDGLALTGHFLEVRALHAVNAGLPPARDRLVRRLTRCP